MKTPAGWLELGRMRSGVARQMFWLFILCALLPVAVLAVVAFVDVRTHLVGLSQRRLHQASKAAGMTLIERLSFLETNLQLVAATVRATGADSLDRRLQDAATRFGARFEQLAVIDAGGRSLSPSRDAALPSLAEQERRHVRSGLALVTTLPAAYGTRSVFMVELLDPAVADGQMLVAKINPAYLWGGDGFLSPDLEMCVFDKAGNTLFTTMPGRAPAVVARRVATSATSGRFEWSFAGEQYLADYWTLFMTPTHLASWVLIQSEPRSEVQRPLREFAWTFSLIVLCAVWVVTLASLRQIRRRTVPVEQLLEATEHLKANDFSYRVRIASRDEFAALGAAFNDMAESIEGHEAAMNAFNRISVSLSVEKDEAQLVETVLSGAQEILNADAAALFTVSKDGTLDLSLARVASLGLSQPGQAGPGGAAGVPPMPAVEGARERSISTPDVHGAGSAEFAPLLDFDRRAGYRSRSFLSVPLREHDNEAIGVLQVVNTRARGTGEIVAFSDDDRRLLESLASSAAVALTKNRLVHDYKGLFEGLTELISTAIDEQSPHTGGHVRRVVILSTMIAEAMSRSRNEAIRSRALSADELYELRIAALLHDCGKLTTPVHLTAKATKLESIVDRFRLIEERAEIASRDHRLGLFAEALRELAPEDDARERLARIDAAGERFDRQLEEDLAVLRLCNEGSDHLPDEMVDAVQSIAATYSWSNLRGERRALVTDDERYHLSTRAGTLTREERAIVQGHVVSTTRMLERLPYPKWLRNVARYAGVHHEQVGGKGYPCGLTGEDIPIQGRIIGIADVLEALTARDRPYRRAMTLPEAAERLAFLAGTGAVDPDLYELIIAEGIHLRYAEEYLPCG